VTRPTTNAKRTRDRIIFWLIPIVVREFRSDEISERVCWLPEDLTRLTIVRGNDPMVFVAAKISNIITK
jgi:hypothetical protein